MIDQMCIRDRPEGGTFLAFVLLEQPEWDAELSLIHICPVLDF